MKKTLTLIVLAGLMLTGCGGKPEAAEPAATATAVAVADDTVTVPGVVGLTLDKATEQLEELGLEVESEDTVDGKMIIKKKNWLVMSQDGAEGATVAKESTVHLGVKSLEKVAAEKAAAEKAAAAKKAVAEKKAAAEKASAEKKAVPEKNAAAEKSAEKAAADQAARDEAARLAAERAAPQQAPAPAPAPVAPAPANVYYPNCAAARAAGAAPVYSGAPGYGTHLDKDRDGIGCDK